MFFKLLFYLFLLKSAFGFGLRYPGTGDTTRQNDYEYNHLLSGWLKLHEERADWLTARVNCHMEGAFLASPWSTDFSSVMHDLINKQLFKYGNYKEDMMWSGVHSSFDEGALKSVDGKQVVSLRHDDLVPLERCGVFRSYYMDQTDCNIALPYTCYRPGPPAPRSMEIPFPPPELNSPTEKTTYPTDVISKTLKKIISSSTELPLPKPAPEAPEAVLIESSKCGDKSLGYQFAELTGHCYKFHAHAVHTWDLAKSACEEEGAYLAIVNSDEEVKVLKKIYAKKIYGAPFPDTAAIGFYKAGRFWKTLEGETIEKAGYAKWRPEAPHFTARLGFIARDGLLYGYMKDVRDVPFICEKPALKQEVYQATELPELKTISTEIEEGIVTNWDLDVVTESTYKAIDSEWNTEAVSVATETNEAILSTWNTESVPVAQEIDEAIKSTWNTESVPVAEQTDEAIKLTRNTESILVAGETDEAIKSTGNTESVPVAGETDEVLKREWQTNFDDYFPSDYSSDYFDDSFRGRGRFPFEY